MGPGAGGRSRRSGYSAICPSPSRFALPDEPCEKLPPHSSPPPPPSARQSCCCAASLFSGTEGREKVKTERQKRRLGGVLYLHPHYRREISLARDWRSRRKTNINMAPFNGFLLFFPSRCCDDGGVAVPR